MRTQHDVKIPCIVENGANIVLQLGLLPSKPRIVTCPIHAPILAAFLDASTEYSLVTRLIHTSSHAVLLSSNSCKLQEITILWWYKSRGFRPKHICMISLVLILVILWYTVLLSSDCRLLLCTYILPPEWNLVSRNVPTMPSQRVYYHYLTKKLLFPSRFSPSSQRIIFMP